MGYSLFIYSSKVECCMIDFYVQNHQGDSALSSVLFFHLWYLWMKHRNLSTEKVELSCQETIELIHNTNIFENCIPANIPIYLRNLLGSPSGKFCNEYDKKLKILNVISIKLFFRKYSRWVNAPGTFELIRWYQLNFVTSMYCGKQCWCFTHMNKDSHQF